MGEWLIGNLAAWLAAGGMLAVGAILLNHLSNHD